MPLGLIDLVETVTPPFFSFRQAWKPRPNVNYKRLLQANCVQVDALKLLAHHTLTNLLHRLAFERHLVGVIPLFGAGRTLCTVQSLKTTVQTGVPQVPVAAAIAGQLVQHIGDLGSIRIDSLLPGILKHWS